MKNVEDIYPLSPMQEMMLLHTLSTPRSEVLTEQFCCTLQGESNVLAFKQAWLYVMDRHPILRTCFLWKGLKKPLQVVCLPRELAWELQDWRHFPPGEQELKLKTYLLIDRTKDFDLTRAPLMRFVLFQINEDTYHFIWSVHHLLLDGWSVSLLLQEVMAFYEAFRNDQIIDLRRPRPYRDYIAWVQAQNLSDAEKFWRQYLKGITAPKPLIIHQTSSSFKHEYREERYREQLLRLPMTTTSALQSLARTHRLTLNTLVQGTWALLLSYYSGQKDVVIGVTVSGRPADLVGVESMVGMFINNLPLRAQVYLEHSLLSFLKSIQSQQIALYPYEYTPLPQIHAWSELPLDLRLFESLIVFENYPVEDALQKEPENIEITNVHNSVRTNYPLSIMVEVHQELNLSITYDTCHFNEATIDGFLQGLKILMENLIQNIERPISTIWSLIREAIDHFMNSEANDKQDIFLNAKIQASTMTPAIPMEKTDRKLLELHDASFVAPRNSLELELVQIWEALLGIRPLGVTHNFFELGGHSFLGVHLMAEIQQRFGQNLPLSTLFQGATVEHLASVLRQHAPQFPRSPLVAIQPHGKKRPFYCIHPSGGGVLCYYDLSRSLGLDQPFYGLEDPKHDEESDYRIDYDIRIENLATLYIDTLRTVQPKGPYALGGWSFGGLVAFEMALQLYTQHQKVSLLALLDIMSPYIVSKYLAVDDATLLVQFAREQALREGKEVSLSLSDLRRLKPREQLNLFLEQMQKAGLALPSDGYSWVQRFLQHSRATVQAIQNYVPQFYRGKITLFRAMNKDTKDLEQLSPSGEEETCNLSYGWDSLSNQPVDIYVVPGTHNTMIFEPNVQVLAQHLRKCLHDAELLKPY